MEKNACVDNSSNDLGTQERLLLEIFWEKK